MPLADPEKTVETTTIAKATLTVTRGVTVGWIAGIPQVWVAQVMGKLLGVRARADIGPRFVRTAAARVGSPLCVAAITFWLTNALTYRWLREHW